MSEATYTPGPWSQAHRIGHDGFYNTEVFDAAGETIATLEWYPKPTVNGVTGTYREGNARLIAAAPDLLEALKLLIEEVQWNREGPIQDGLLVCVNKAVAAIAKATGESA